MTRKVDIDELLGCHSARIRRATRRVAQIYERTMEPAGVTGSQFTLLGNLLGAAQAGHPGVPASVLAARLDIDPTTLTRTLKPLRTQKLVRERRGDNDRRVRLIEITDKGRAALIEAIPHWRRAQKEIEGSLGNTLTAALREALDRSLDKLTA